MHGPPHVLSYFVEFRSYMLCISIWLVLTLQCFKIGNRIGKNECLDNDKGIVIKIAFLWFLRRNFIF